MRKRSISSADVQDVSIGKRQKVIRAKVIVISDSESVVGTTHLRMLTVDQLDQNELTFIQDDVHVEVEQIDGKLDLFLT